VDPGFFFLPNALAWSMGRVTCSWSLNVDSCLKKKAENEFSASGYLPALMKK